MLAKTKQAKSGGMFCHESMLLIQLKNACPLGEEDAVGRDGLEMVEADAGRDLTLVDGEVAVHQVGRPVEQARLILKYSGHEPW